MFPIVLILHSLTRWFVLLTLVISLFYSFKGWYNHEPFKKNDNHLRFITVSFAHTQLVLGLWLYFTSPLVRYFLENFKESIHVTQLRFFGMEHITMMLLAVMCITMGSSISRRKKNDREKFKAIALWYSIGFILIFTSIPWAFSPFTNRPYFRFF